MNRRSKRIFDGKDTVFTKQFRFWGKEDVSSSRSRKGDISSPVERTIGDNMTNIAHAYLNEFYAKLEGKATLLSTSILSWGSQLWILWKLISRNTF